MKMNALLCKQFHSRLICLIKVNMTENPLLNQFPKWFNMRSYPEHMNGHNPIDDPGKIRHNTRQLNYRHWMSCWFYEFMGLGLLDGLEGQVLESFFHLLLLHQLSVCLEHESTYDVAFDNTSI